MIDWCHIFFPRPFFLRSGEANKFVHNLRNKISILCDMMYPITELCYKTILFLLKKHSFSGLLYSLYCHKILTLAHCSLPDRLVVTLQTHAGTC